MEWISVLNWRSNPKNPMNVFPIFKKRTNLRAVLGGSVAAIVLAVPGPGEAALLSYYVGVDGRTTIPSGIYGGLPNPNGNRLTFLYAHSYEDTPESNHYHAKGVHVYTGPNFGAGTATTIASSNYLPEGALPPLLLQDGFGAYAGKKVNVPDIGNPFSLLTIGDVGQISSFPVGSPEQIMFNSSSNRWTTLLSGADVHMKLVFATPGLNFGTAGDPNSNPFAPVDGLHLDDAFSFTLHPWVDAGAAPGNYVAQFQLADETNTFGDSGTFEFRFQVVPEPGSAVCLLLGGLVAATRRRRH